jgi:hypothetical protein
MHLVADSRELASGQGKLVPRRRRQNGPKQAQEHGQFSAKLTPRFVKRFVFGRDLNQHVGPSRSGLTSRSTMKKLLFEWTSGNRILHSRVREACDAGRADPEGAGAQATLMSSLASTSPCGSPNERAGLAVQQAACLPVHRQIRSKLHALAYEVRCTRRSM